MIAFKRLPRFTFGLLLFFGLLSSCVEVDPPPAAPEIPTVEPSELLRIGIESSLQSLQPILEEPLNQVANSSQMTLFVGGSTSDLQEQLLAGDVGGIFVYQKPVNGSLWTTPVALNKA